MKAVHEATPFGVVGVGEIKLDRDMIFDVDGLQDGRRGCGNGGRDILDGGGEGRLGTGVGVGGVEGGEIEEGVSLQVHDGMEEAEEEGRSNGRNRSTMADRRWKGRQQRRWESEVRIE